MLLSSAPSCCQNTKTWYDILQTPCGHIYCDGKQINLNAFAVGSPHEDRGLRKLCRIQSQDGRLCYFTMYCLCCVTAGLTVQTFYIHHPQCHWYNTVCECVWEWWKEIERVGNIQRHPSNTRFIQISFMYKHCWHAAVYLLPFVTVSVSRTDLLMT